MISILLELELLGAVYVMDKINCEIERLLFKIPGVVNFNSQKLFEVKPGRSSPIYINIKNTLGDFETRCKIVRNLSRLISLESDYICGIESGGSYYACVIADHLMKPLVLFRNREKVYGDKGWFVGSIPSGKNKLIAIVDDVIVSGKTITPVIKFLKDKGFKVKLYAVFSYGLDTITSKRFSTTVDSASNINTLCEVGKKLKIFSQEDIDFISKFTQKIKNEIIKSNGKNYEEGFFNS